MRIKDISNVALFEPLLEFGCGNCFIDLHNDWECCKIEQADCFIISFVSLNTQSEVSYIHLVFLDFKLLNQFEISNKNSFKTLTNFQRCRFSLGNGLVDEYENRKDFLLEFMEGAVLDILAVKVLLIML